MTDTTSTATHALSDTRQRNHPADDDADEYHLVHGRHDANEHGDGEDAETLSPLEQEVLDEYARLLGNMNNLSTLLSSLSATPSAEILDALRGLERKTSLVFTLLKASVYSIVLNTQIRDEESAGGGGGGVQEEQGRV